MPNVQLDMNDPKNPIAKVRELDIEFTAIYKGTDAWNANVIVAKLERELRERGFDLRSFHLEHSYDENHKEITEDEMREYIYKKHGHVQGKCASCPDPIKWKELEKLKLKEYYSNKEILDDMRRGRVKQKFMDMDFRKYSPYETLEETKRRLGLIPKTEDEEKLYKKTSKKNNWQSKRQEKESEENYDIEPRLQFNGNK